jgi:hypothetical protein
LICIVNPSPASTSIIDCKGVYLYSAEKQKLPENRSTCYNNREINGPQLNIFSGMFISQAVMRDFTGRPEGRDRHLQGTKIFSNDEKF